MTHLIGVAVLIWIAVTYDIWTAIGFFVLYAIVVFGVFTGLLSITAWWEERAENTKAKVWRGLIYIVAALLAVAWFAPQARPTHAQLLPQPQLSPPATAQIPLHLPPVVYDQPYKGRLTTEIVTPEQLRTRCYNATLRSLGCAFPGSNNCHIIMLDEARINAAGWTVELMLRHERAHCNGWTQDHPGKRPL